MPAVLDDARIFNETFFNYLETPGMEKKALDSMDDFTRTVVREDGFFRKILPMKLITNDDLHPQVETDKPIRVEEKEPRSPAAITVGFGSLPRNVYIRGPKYRVEFCQMLTPRFVKNIEELRTWRMDIRQVLSDNSLRDLLAEEDNKWITACNTAMGGSANVVNPTTNSIQWQTISGGVTRDTLEDAFKVLPQVTDFQGHSGLEVNSVLVNNITIREIMKFGRDEMGGDYSQEIFKSGRFQQEFMGVQWYVTIKRIYVPDDTIFMYGDPRFIGKSYALTDTTMYVKKEASMIEFYSYETIGSSIGNVSSISRVDFI